MEKLNLQRDKKDFYELEVNDKGDKIVFDLMDIGLLNNIMVASDKIALVDKKCKEEIEKVQEQYKDDKEKIIRETTRIELEKCLELRKYFDSFLGEGACQKIFGNTNRYEQFIDLMYALEPHFAKMEIQILEAKKRLAEKYKPKKNDVM